MNLLGFSPEDDAQRKSEEQELESSQMTVACDCATWRITFRPCGSARA